MGLAEDSTAIEPLPRFVGLHRKNGDIFAVTSVLIAPLPYVVPDIDLNPYALVAAPLAELDNALFAKKTLVLNAWRALKSVSAPDADALKNIFIILLETDLIASDNPVEQALPDFKQKIDAPKPTAAHPRAFKGTKTKPPKNAVAVHNLQPLLFAERGVNYLLEQLKEYRPKALGQLMQLGYKVDSLDSAFSLKTRSLYFAQDTPLAAALARLASFEPKSGINAWTNLIATRPDGQKLSLVITSVTTGACDLDIEDVQQYLKTLDCLCSDHEELIKAYWVLMDALSNDHDAEYVLNGFRIRHALGKPQKFNCIEHSIKNLDWQLLLDIDAALSDKSDTHERLPGAYPMWEKCGEAPHIVQILPDILTSNPYHKQVEDFIHFLVYSKYLDNDPIKTMDAKRKVAAKYTRQLFEALLATDPKYRGRCIAEMQEFFWTPDSVKCVEDNMTGFLALLPRLCAPPFSPSLNLLGTACGFTESFGIGVLSVATDRVLLALEAQCNNTQSLVANSLAKLCKALPELTLRCLYTNTTKLCNVAKLFGTVPAAKERELLKTFNAHALMKAADDLSLKKLHELVQPLVGEGIASPFSAKITAFLAGNLTLTMAQIARAHSEALDKLDSTRLDLLRNLIHAELTATVPPDLRGEHTLHAMQIYNRSEDNRRAFKSFLKAHFNGRADYRESHPLSRKWLAKHSKLDADLFRQGIVLTEEIEDFGPVTISVEQDPFEALKLGTYVNSCFSVNGICNYSALAIVLDINKRVLYARDAKGKLLARQIVVWDEADLLESFKVYPEKTARPLKLLFRKYDLAFADALGTTLYDGNSWDEDAPAVINILSECWWDDGSWDASELVEDEEHDEVEDDNIGDKAET